MCFLYQIWLGGWAKGLSPSQCWNLLFRHKAIFLAPLRKSSLLAVPLSKQRLANIVFCLYQEERSCMITHLVLFFLIAVGLVCTFAGGLIPGGLWWACWMMNWLLWWRSQSLWNLGTLCKVKYQARIIVKIGLPSSATASKCVEIWAHNYMTLRRLFSVSSSLNLEYKTHLFQS